MKLAFRYPPGWEVHGDTFEATIGIVGNAYATFGTLIPSKSLFTVHQHCKARAQVARGSGVVITWSAGLDRARLHIAGLPGRHLTVNGWPAVLQQSTSGSICAGPLEIHVREHSMVGRIQEGPHTEQVMDAEIGTHATRQTVATIEQIFASTRR